MYRFQIRASTEVGESIGIIGSIPELGQWDIHRCLRLHTSGDRYPLWSADIEIHRPPSLDSSPPPVIEYKYVHFNASGWANWEGWGTNRWVPWESVNPGHTLVVEDGTLGSFQPWPYGYLEPPVPHIPLPQGAEGLKIVVIGSSVALGCSAWLLNGWAARLEKALHERYGHQVVNRSELGANVTTTMQRFSQVVPPEHPDIVIIALSLGNEGLAYCPPQYQRAVQRRFERGLQQLLVMTRELGAYPMLAGVYPHQEYSPEQYAILRETHQRMLGWGVPVLDWFSAVDNGQGRWKTGIFLDPAHPNTEGHRRMYETIDLDQFAIRREEVAQASQVPPTEISVYEDTKGFEVLASTPDKQLRLINTSPHAYRLSPAWRELQDALRQKAGLMPGIYIARNASQGTLPFFSVQEDGTIETTLEIPPSSDLTYSAVFHFFSPRVSQILFYDEQLGILKESEQTLRVINESDHDYNVHPMWKEVRRALKAMPPGVYEDPLHPDAPFRTMMIGPDGLESRVKVPPKSSILLHYQCPLSEISRVAILPLGDRCAIRMLLYKMEYDGPAFPFDLTRTTNLSDVADMIEQQFQDMWNPNFLHYNHQERRIYHTKWTGLSFAHEVEDTDNPLYDMSPVHKRMRVRYSARAARFWYTLQACDKVLFVRTGGTHRAAVVDLLNKLETKCQGKPFRLLIISPQSSAEFADLPNVLHYDMEFNPDRMYEDLDHWMYCTGVMRDILESLGVSSKNLFWCPPNPPTA